MTGLRPGAATRSALTRLVQVVVASSLATGCLGTSPDPRFYTLSAYSAGEGLEPLEADGTPLGVGVGPIQLPRYLQRPQIVTRRGDHRLDYHELHRWGGSLESEILRVLGQNLSALLGTDRVAVYPVQSAFPLDYRVRMDVEQFDGEPGGEVKLRVRWVIGPGDGGDALAVGYSSLSQEVDSSGYGGLVWAHGELLSTLSREITQRIRELLQWEEGGEPTSEAEPLAGRDPS